MNSVMNDRLDRRPRCWITYAWSDNAEGDFQFLAAELAGAGIDAVYDRISIVPGRDLWGQIASNIAEPSLDGWLYLLTPNSLESEACREELAGSAHATVPVDPV